MALVNPQNLYSGAAQVFNNTPHLAFQARLLAQERARQEALDNYYRKLPLTINEKGVRDQERETISKSSLAIKEYWLNNKNKLRKGDDAAAFNYEQMIREHQDKVSKSQALGLTSVQTGKLRFSPTTGYMFRPKEVVEKLRLHELPLDHPDHVDFDLDEFTAAPKPYDRSKYFKNFALLKGNDNIKRVPNGDGTQTIINTPTYEDEHKKYVMEVAADNYLYDESFAQMVNEGLGAPDATNPLNADFKEHFGHDIQTPIDLATAYTFNGLKPLPQTEKIQQDPVAMMRKRQQFSKEQQARQFGHSAAMQRKAQGYRKAIIDYKADKTVEENDSVLNRFIGKLDEAGSSNYEGKNVENITIGGTKYKGKFIDVPNSVKEEYKIPDYVNKKFEYPTKFYLTEDKKTFIPLFFGAKTATGGNYIKPDSKPVPVELFKVSLSKVLLTKKDTGGEVIADDVSEFTEEEIPIQTPSVKKTTKKDPLGLF